MSEKIILTDNSEELIEGGWDGERFWLFKLDKILLHIGRNQNIILNPREAHSLAQFVLTRLGLKEYSHEEVK